MVAAQPVARFALTDHDGRQVTEADYRGRYILAYFGFTHCQVVCPRSLAKLSRVLDQLGDMANAVDAVYITTDPARDTPRVMKSYLETAYPRFTGLTGTEAQIDAAKKAFRVFAERKADPTDPDGYGVPHTAIAYLMAPDGSYLTHFTDAVDEQLVVKRIASAMQETNCDEGAIP